MKAFGKVLLMLLLMAAFLCLLVLENVKPAASDIMMVEEALNPFMRYESTEAETAEEPEPEAAEEPEPEAAEEPEEETAEEPEAEIEEETEPEATEEPEPETAEEPEPETAEEPEPETAEEPEPEAAEELEPETAEEHEPEAAEEPEPETAEEHEPEAAEEHEPEATEETEAETAEEPEEGAAEENEPETEEEIEALPDWDLSPLPDSYFDDALFFGDSISVTLSKHCVQTGDLGEALFLCEFSYSVRNAYTGNLKIWYQGQQYAPEDVVPLTGANKIFVMLGVNDIALYGGIDKTMMCWEHFVSTIREKSPDVTFFIESCLPIYRSVQYDAWNNDLFDEYNQRLRQFCEDNGCVFVDIAHYFKDDYNSLADEYCSDFYCHVTYAATEVWAEQLKNPANYSVDPRSLNNGQDA